MRVELRHQPSFSVARCHLAPGEPVQAESGAMVATSFGVGIAARMEGGLLAGLKRSVLGGESLFITTYTAPAQGGWIDVAAHLPGDIATLTLVPDRPPFLITRGCWIANAYGTQLDTQWAGMQNLFGGEGGFLIQASGQGEVVLGCYGALDHVDLSPGETITVDSGHLVAYDSTIQHRLRRAVEGRSIQSLKTGEGFVFDFTGPGHLMLQTRNQGALLSYLTANLPFQRR